MTHRDGFPHYQRTRGRTHDDEPENPTDPSQVSSALQSVIMAAIVQASLVEEDGVRVCRIDATAVVDAFSNITASQLATSTEARTPEGVKRMLRRQARQLEHRMSEFNQHVAQHGSPFSLTA